MLARMNLANIYGPVSTQDAQLLVRWKVIESNSGHGMHRDSARRYLAVLGK